MTLTLALFMYFIATIIIFAIHDKQNDWDLLPPYVLFIILAPVSVPVSFFVYLAYKFYTKLIKPRINK